MSRTPVGQTETSRGGSDAAANEQRRPGRGSGQAGSTARGPGVDKSADRVRQMFSEIAGRYDQLNRLLSAGVDLYWRWRTVRAVPPPRSGRVLDVCTGTGDLALAYWRHGRGQVRVVGADFAHPMLVLAKRKAARRCRGGRVPEFVEADALELPFPDDCFDVVSVAFGLRNVADTDRGLAEMTRVCRPGGHVVVLEFSLPTVRPVRAVYLWYFRRVLPWVGQLLARNRHQAYHYLPQSVSEFPRGNALAKRMESSGLTAVWWKPLTLGIATLYCGRKPEPDETLGGPSRRPRSVVSAGGSR